MAAQRRTRSSAVPLTNDLDRFQLDGCRIAAAFQVSGAQPDDIRSVGSLPDYVTSANGLLFMSTTFVTRELTRR